MALLKLYPNGLTVGNPPMKNNHQRAKRGEVVGWSKSASRNNKKFLYSIDTSSLNGIGYAFTLTLRDCPETSDEWRNLRKVYFDSLRSKSGFLRLHWVTEWQRRGVPHLHGIVFYNEPKGGIDLTMRMAMIKKTWVDLTAWSYGSNIYAQHVDMITEVSGWFKYLSKHSARGAEHYQRSSENIPEGWKKTGKVWGHWGDWVVSDPVEIELEQSAFYVFRRVVRAWRKSDVRSEKIEKVRIRRIKSARKMLSCGERKLSEVRGVSEWIDKRMAEKILWNLVLLGFDITERPKNALACDLSSEIP